MLHMIMGSSSCPPTIIKNQLTVLHFGNRVPMKIVYVLVYFYTSFFVSFIETFPVVKGFRCLLNSHEIFFLFLKQPLAGNSITFSHSAPQCSQIKVIVKTE